MDEPAGKVPRAPFLLCFPYFSPPPCPNEDAQSAQVLNSLQKIVLEIVESWELKADFLNYSPYCNHKGILPCSLRLPKHQSHWCCLGWNSRICLILSAVDIWLYFSELSLQVLPVTQYLINVCVNYYLRLVLIEMLF